jgi:hypothetical protein
LFLTYTGIQDPDPDPHSFSKLDPDPDTHSPKKLDPDPHKVNADPKHTVFDVFLFILFAFGSQCLHLILKLVPVYFCQDKLSHGTRYLLRRLQPVRVHPGQN